MEEKEKLLIILFFLSFNSSTVGIIHDVKKNVFIDSNLHHSRRLHVCVCVKNHISCIHVTESGRNLHLC